MPKELIKNLQQQDRHAIQTGCNKNSFCRTVAVGIDINGKQNDIRQQAQRTDTGDHFVVIEKFFDKNGKRGRSCRYKIHDK